MNNVATAVFLSLFGFFILTVAKSAIGLFSIPFNFIVPLLLVGLLAFLVYRNIAAFKGIPADLVAFKSYLSQMTMDRGVTISLFFLFGVILPILGMMNCSGWNEGSGTVASCLIGGGFMAVYANFYYGFMLISAFALLIPLIIYISILIFLHSFISKRTAKSLGTFSILGSLLQFVLAVTGPFALALSVVTFIVAITGLLKNRVEGNDKITLIKCTVSLIVSIIMAIGLMSILGN